MLLTLKMIARSIHLPSSRPVAIKIIDLENSEDDIAENQLEISHLADCDSQWVTRYYGSFLRGWKLWIGASPAGFPRALVRTRSSCAARRAAMWGRWLTLCDLSQSWSTSPAARASTSYVQRSPSSSPSASRART